MCAAGGLWGEDCVVGVGSGPIWGTHILVQIFELEEEYQQVKEFLVNEVTTTLGNTWLK